MGIFDSTSTQTQTTNNQVTEGGDALNLRVQGQGRVTIERTDAGAVAAGAEIAAAGAALGSDALALGESALGAAGDATREAFDFARDVTDQQAGFGMAQFNAALSLASKALDATGQVYEGSVRGVFGYVKDAEAERADFARTAVGGDSERLFQLGRYLLIGAGVLAAVFALKGATK